MPNPLRMKSWSPYFVGAAIGVLSWFAFASADHPLGITTAFERTAALAEHSTSARTTQPPTVDWEWMLVLGVFLGGFLSAWLSGDRTTRLEVPRLWKWRFGPGAAKRLSAAFFGGALMMFGARLAKGCTSGHGISGTLQLAASSWTFLIVFFAVGIGTALLLFGREGIRHV